MPISFTARVLLIHKVFTDDLEFGIRSLFKKILYSVFMCKYYHGVVSLVIPHSTVGKA
jgi:hypothetical protein